MLKFQHRQTERAKTPIKQLAPRVSKRELSRFVRSLGLVKSDVNQNTDDSHLSNLTSITQPHNLTSDADDSDIPLEEADAAFSECADYFAEAAQEEAEQSAQMKVGEAFEYAPGKYF